MSPDTQKTVLRSVSVEGIGVHSGEPAVLTLRPAEPDTGVRFRRVDLDGTPEIPADLAHVAATDLGTSLCEGDVRVLTVEHVLAALAAHRVDNVMLELSGPEPPIRDGSFVAYFDAIKEAGLTDQGVPARIVEVTDPLEVRVDSGASYVVAANSNLRISATIDFEHPAIGRQFGTFDITRQAFESELATARTFGFKADAEALHERGLALGASLENTVVLDDHRVLNDELRFPDEFLRHKVGDLVGDLALLGAQVRGHIVADRPSHEGNVALARALAGQDRRKRGNGVVDIQRIMKCLPHRYPMLLIDKILEFEAEKRIVGIKNVTINEPFFQGHFPDHPIMPGVLLIEAMAQVGGLLLMESAEHPEDSVVYFMSMDRVKWRKPVVPGDQVVFEVELLQRRGTVFRIGGVGKVDGEVVVEGELTAKVMDK
ncbi:MAG: bifunctional UDP-3-O-[3-hydroxymyristoyl] N-acetylglucosamine deacetylase/3-hydroxyacyl-ACP dehydratase [Gemmatimonadetes bacterium]|nr:bifunctional UDP-3-O-[3-hydroxymyristoyl] N-acetylglucosamine deacetylase/3-hydroxyacyl-ACP dehydratase [Gemmatimonadota bacterium]